MRPCLTKFLFKEMNLQHSIDISIRTQIFVSHGSVKTLLTLGRKCVHYCVANLFRIQCTKVYQNWMSSVQDMAQTFRLTFF